MRNRPSTSRFLLFVLLAALTACDSDPAGPGSPDAVAITLNAETHGFGTTSTSEPDAIRVTVRDASGGSLDSHTESLTSGSVDGSFGPYDLTIGSTVAGGSVEVELYRGDASERILWSGRVEGASLPAGEAASVDIDLYRGGLPNLDLTSVALIGLPAQMQTGTTTTLSISSSPSDIEAQPFWGSLDPEVAEVNEDGLLTAGEPGDARVIVAAGSGADTVTVTVTEGEPDPGEFGSSRSFDQAQEQWIEISPAGVLSFPDEAWTFSVWARPGEIEGGEWFHYAVSSGDVFEGGGPGFQVYYGETENVHHWHVSVNNDDGEGGHHVLPVPPRPTTGAWTHVTVRYDGEAEVELFVNGRSRDSFPFSGPVNLPDPINVGRRADGDGVRYLDGQVAHLARWDGMLTDAQILDIARGMHPMSLQGPTLEWFIPLGLEPEEAFGSVGETLDFELMNGPTVGPAPPVSGAPSG